MSSSYGPGRNDPNYEEKGRDYPIGYVRWTENRNMQTFLNLLATGRLDISSLITHTYSLTESPRAYDMLLEYKEDYTGIDIEYDTEKKFQKRSEFTYAAYTPRRVRSVFIGGGLSS